MDTKIELTQKQADAFKELKKAFEYCSLVGINFIFDEDDAAICAINGNEIDDYVNASSSNYDILTDTTEMPFLKTDALIIDSSSDKVGIIY